MRAVQAQLSDEIGKSRADAIYPIIVSLSRCTFPNGRLSIHAQVIHCRRCDRAGPWAGCCLSDQARSAQTTPTPRFHPAVSADNCYRTARRSTYLRPLWKWRSGTHAGCHALSEWCRLGGGPDIVDPPWRGCNRALQPNWIWRHRSLCCQFKCNCQPRCSHTGGSGRSSRRPRCRCHKLPRTRR